ncbi:MAG TPA: hypothetical protein VLA01_00530 [Nitrosopumilaceae archaeon]|nr:hypothetical protein [Nitrosopumilaceae archaeon]
MKQRLSHDSLIRRLIDHFQTQDFRISFANYEGFTKPFAIKRHSPDVVAVNRLTGLVHIGIVKFCASLYDEITKEEFEDFSNILMKGSENKKIVIPFYIAVPNECRSKIKEIFRYLEIPWIDNIHVLGF